METSKILEIVLREMLAYGQAYRENWSEFDGRTLRHQLQAIALWAEYAMNHEDVSDYTAGTEFLYGYEED